MKKMLMIGLVLGSMVVAKADTNITATLPAVPAVAEQTVELKAIVTSVECMFLPPVYTNMQIIVRFNVNKPDGTLFRMDGMRITQAQIAASGDPAIPIAMAGMGAKVNEVLIAYLASVRTNADWLAGKPIRK